MSTLTYSCCLRYYSPCYPIPPCVWTPCFSALHAWLCGDTSSAWTWSSGASKVPAMGEDSFSTAHHIATYELPNMAQNGNLCQMGKIRTFETARCLELWLIRAGLVPRKERSRSSSSWNQKFGFKWCQEMWCFWEPFSTSYPPCQNQAQQGLLSLLRFYSNLVPVPLARCKTLKCPGSSCGSTSLSKSPLRCFDRSSSWRSSKKNKTKWAHLMVIKQSNMRWLYIV